MSNDDELLRALGAIAREREEERGESAGGRAAWERFAAGAGSVEEALAAGGDEGLSEDEARALAELLQPRPRADSGSDEAELVERMAAMLAQGKGPMGHITKGGHGATGGGAAPAPIDLAAARARRRLGLGGAALAGAAALMLWVTSGEPAKPLALPEYGLVARNLTVLNERGETAGVARYRTESEIDWVLAPAEPIAAATGVVILVEGTDFSTLVQPPVERSEEGALRIRGTIGERLGPAAGQYTLRFLIGPAEGLPGDAGAVEGALAAGVVREATPRYGIQILE